MNKGVDTSRPEVLIFLIVLVVLLAIAIAAVAFRLGQQATVDQGVDPAGAVMVAPPQIATNTPTVTPPPTHTPVPTGTATSTSTPTPTPTPTPIVVITHIESLGRLETAEFAMRTVVDLENEPSNRWEEFVGSDKLMLVAEGEVVAGIDLAEVTAEQIKVDGTRVEMDLPAPEILYSRIDNERTQVYQRETGLFVRPDPSLESRARQLAEESLVEWAEQRGIYERAAQGAELQLENLLRSLGFTEIIINVEDKGI